MTIKLATYGALLALAFTGCAGSESNTKIVLGNASTSVYENTRTNFARIKTFAVGPLNEATDVDAQLLFFVRNEMESKGYRFVPQGEVDIVVTEKLIPQNEPAPTIPPIYQLIRSSVTSPTKNSWGNYSSSISAADLTAPSVFTGQAASRAFHPAALLAVYDGKSDQLLWHGVGKSDSDSDDPRISGQDAIVAALANFPRHKSKQPRTERYGAIGIRVQIYSTDGRSYFPMVVEFAEKSPAREAGMKEKDRIVAVDGRPLTNLTFMEANDTIRGKPDSFVMLEVLRGEQRLMFTMQRSPWSGVWGDLSPN